MKSFIYNRLSALGSLFAIIFSLTISVFLLGMPVQATAEASSPSPEKMTIGFIPGENPDTLRENGIALAEMLKARVGVPVEIFISKDYTSLVDAMKEKKIDFAFFSAVTYVFAEKQANAKVLLKKVWGGPFYYATILTRADSKILKIEQLKGKKIAFVDQKSASGYLYPELHFKKMGIDPKTFFSEITFSGNHEKSVQLLRDGKVDAIAIYSNDAKARDTAWQKYASVLGAKTVATKAIWVSEPIPNDPFCVRQDFYDKYPKYAHDIMFALIEMNDDPKEATRFKRLLGVSSLMFATSQQYEPVREMVKELNLSLQ